MAELGKGWRSKPSAVTQHDKTFAISPPRFCMSEQHGKQEAKYRVIDDLPKSHVGGAAGACETYFTHYLCAFVVLAILHRKYGADKLRMWSADFSNAYKKRGLNKESGRAARICFSNPANNLPYKAKVLARPPGIRRAPANWGSVATCLQFVACEVLRLATENFADDVFCAESRRVAMSGFWAFKQLCLFIGAPPHRATKGSRRQPDLFY